MSDLDRYKGKLNDEYELIMKAWPYEKELRIETAQAIANTIDKDKASILELGSGSGETTSYIFDELEKKNALAQAHITSVDLDTALAKKQEESFREYIENDLLTVKAEDGVAYLNALPQNSLDICTASWFLHNFRAQKRLEIIGSIFRALKPGGLLVLMDKVVPDDRAEEEKLYNEQIERFKVYSEAGRPDLFDAMSAHEKEDRMPDFILKQSEFEKSLKDVGFRVVQVVKRYLRDVVLVAGK